MTSLIGIDRAPADDVDDRRRNPDRRGSVRRKILRSARTIWPNGDSSECMICNISETGAKLILCGPVPNLFDLVIEGDQRRHECEVVWRQDTRVGVKFKNQPQIVISKPASASVQCHRYADECRKLAERSAPSDRGLLLEMANSWMSVARRLRRKSS